jgi:hypothetical protein
MDNIEAKQILSAHINQLRNMSYAELCHLIGKTDSREQVGDSGTMYQLEIQAWWDDRSEQNLRVTVSIDDGGWRAFVPLTDDFIIAPDGSFVGE